MKIIRKPKVVLVIDDKISNTAIAKVSADIIELRVDCFKRRDVDYVQQQIERRRALKRPLLLTIRNQKSEGAQSQISDEEKLSLFALCMKRVDMIDIEASSPVCRPVMVLAKKLKKPVIASAHFFHGAPLDLAKIYDRIKVLGPDWIKIAVMPRKVEDIWRLLALTQQKQGKLISMAMGDLGKLSRLFLPMAGSPWVYTFLGKSKAPGQIDIKTLTQHLKFYYP